MFCLVSYGDPVLANLWLKRHIYSSLSQESVCEARQKQKRLHDPMWPVRFVCLQPGDVPVCHFKDEDLGEVSLHSLYQDMVCGRLDCRTLPVLGLAIVHV